MAAISAIVSTSVAREEPTWEAPVPAAAAGTVVVVVPARTLVHVASVAASVPVASPEVPGIVPVLQHVRRELQRHLWHLIKRQVPISGVRLVYFAHNLPVRHV
jgi:hypothetical protein